LDALYTGTRTAAQCCLPLYVGRSPATLHNADQSSAKQPCAAATRSQRACAINGARSWQHPAATEAHTGPQTLTLHQLAAAAPCRALFMCCSCMRSHCIHFAPQHPAARRARSSCVLSSCMRTSCVRSTSPPQRSSPPAFAPGACEVHPQAYNHTHPSHLSRPVLCLLLVTAALRLLLRAHATRHASQAPPPPQLPRRKIATRATICACPLL
jgi:hypothetical protein